MMKTMRRDAYYYYFVKKKIIDLKSALSWDQKTTEYLTYTYNTLANFSRINTQVLLG